MSVKTKYAIYKLKKKILITGASGSVAGIVREIYSKHEMELWSTKCLVANKKNKVRRSGDLVETSWWRNPPLDNHYDIIFHLAESVKKNMAPESVNKIIMSHTGFLAEAVKRSPVIVYPITAYRFDNSLSGGNWVYKFIKESVAGHCINDGKILLPVIHPIIDYGNGLSATRKMIHKFPIINLFSEFKAEIPVLYLEDFKRYLLSVENQRGGIVNVYTRKMKICDIFENKNKWNCGLVSSFGFHILKSICLVSSVNLLVNGREIND